MIVMVGILFTVKLYIHPMWVIDDAAIIDFIFVWFIPSKDPIIALMEQINTVNDEYIDSMNVKILIGAIFCHVDKMKHEVHEIDVITDGNQK